MRLNRNAVTWIFVILVVALPSPDVMAFGPATDDKLKFRVFKSVDWLTCRFGPVVTDSGEILEYVGFDPDEDRARVRISSREETEMIEALFEDEKGPFSKPMVFIFDMAKTRVRLLYPSILIDDMEASVTSKIYLQEVGWLTPGAFMINMLIEFKNVPTVMNLNIISGKTKAGAYQAYASYSMFGLMVLMSAQCSEEIDEAIRPIVEEKQMELQDNYEPAKN